MSENRQDFEPFPNPQDSQLENNDHHIQKDGEGQLSITKESSSGVLEESSLPPREIFVVLSERGEFNTACLNVLNDYGIKAIVLNQPNEIRAISEILNTSATVTFALILLSGDDFIYDRLKGKPVDAVLGAKPHVIFLLGYLLAKFGHMGTLVLYRDQKSFRLPTGFQHLAFVPFQGSGDWKEILTSKLKALKIL